MMSRRRLDGDLRCIPVKVLDGRQDAMLEVLQSRVQDRSRLLKMSWGTWREARLLYGPDTCELADVHSAQLKYGDSKWVAHNTTAMVKSASACRHC